MEGLCGRHELESVAAVVVGVAAAAPAAVEAAVLKEDENSFGRSDVRWRKQ